MGKTKRTPTGAGRDTGLSDGAFSRSDPDFGSVGSVGSILGSTL